MADDIRLAGGSAELAGLELRDHISNQAATSNDNVDPCRRQRLVRVGTAVARQDGLDAVVRHQLG